MPSSPPAETVVYPSRWKLIPWTVLFLTLAMLGTYLMVRTPLPSFSTVKPVLGFLFGCCMVVLFAANGVRTLVLLVRNQPVFRLGVLGIQLGTGPLDSWESIREERVVETTGRYGKTMLSYFTFDGTRQLNVAECAISATTLTELLHYYRDQALSTTTDPARRRYNL